MWWCPTCEKYLEWDEVTYEETHDERIGGCGRDVLPEKPTTAREKIVENLKDSIEDMGFSRPKDA